MASSMFMWALAAMVTVGAAMDAEMAKVPAALRSSRSAGLKSSMDTEEAKIPGAHRAARSAELTKRQAPEDCGQTYTSMFGTIQSFNYPDRYHNNAICDWTIRAPAGQQIELEFQDPFRLEIPLPGGDCYADELEIYDGGSGAPLTTAVCGKTNPGTIVSENNEVYLNFHSDGSLGFPGFRINYRFIGGTSGCNTVHTEDNGVITSPNYPQDYTNDLTCEWAIVAPPGKRIEITFDDDYRIEIPNSSGYCYADRLEIYDGATTNPPTETVCGKTVPDSFQSDHNIVSLRFETDGSLGFKGFKLYYYFY